MSKRTNIQVRMSEDLKIEVMIKAEETAQGNMSRYIKDLILKDLKKGEN